MCLVMGTAKGEPEDLCDSQGQEHNNGGVCLMNKCDLRYVSGDDGHGKRRAWGLM